MLSRNRQSGDIHTHSADTGTCLKPSLPSCNTAICPWLQGQPDRGVWVQVVIKDKAEQDEASQAEALRQAAQTFKLPPLASHQGAGTLTSQSSGRRPFAFKAAEQHSSVRCSMATLPACL